MIVVTYNWGVDEPPGIEVTPGSRLPLPPEELPEVVELRRQGWALAPDPPMWVFLPAVWPQSHRTWVADRATRWVTNYRDGQLVERVPWSGAVYESVESDYNELLREAGIAPRPAGRLWLLKAPPMFVSLDQAVEALVGQGLAKGSEIEPNCNPAFVDYVQQIVSGWFGQDSRLGI
jgi:hypothetical protein